MSFLRHDGRPIYVCVNNVAKLVAYKKKIRANDARSTITLTNYFKKGKFDDPAVSLTQTTVSIITCNPPETQLSELVSPEFSSYLSWHC